MKFGFESNDYKAALVISFLLALVVFLPVLLGHNFPLWSTDNLFGSYPPLEISRRQFLSGDAAWFPLAGRGIDFSASVNNFSYSPIFRLIFFSSASATFVASSIVQFICFWGVGFIFYFVAKNIVKERNSALFALVVYQLSFATLYYLQTFPNIVLQLFFLLSVLIVQNSSRINPVLLASALAATMTTLLLTGHVVYAVYFLVAHLLVTGRCLILLDAKEDRNNLMIAYVVAVFISALIAQYRLIPFLGEVLNGSRVTSHFFPGMIIRPLAFFHLFVPEIFGISLNKSSELDAVLNLRNTNLSFYGLNDMHSTFLYSGIAGILLMMGAVQIKAARFWFFVSLYFVLEVTFPGLIGIFSNAVFYPFQHNSHIYLANFFWAITAAITLSHLSDIQQYEKFERFLSRFQVIFVPFLLGTMLTICAALMFWQNSLLWFAKAMIMLVAIALILYSYKNFDIQESSVKLNSFSMNRLVGFTIVALVLAVFAFVFSSPAGRSAVLFLAVSIAILGLYFPMHEKSMLDCADKIFPVIRIFILIGLTFGISEFVLPLIPRLGTIDYPLDGYYRIENEYSRLNTWPNEWLVLVVLALCKLYLVVFWLLRIIRSSTSKSGSRSFVVFLVLLSLTDQLPTFLEYAHYTSKPFVRVDYGKLFEPSESNLDPEPLGYRLTNVHKALPVSTLFDYRPEAEVLSNLPYAFGYRSYGGVNSQIPKRQRVFYDTYVENRTIKDKLPNQPIDEIAVGTNYTDEGLLALLGVKYNIEGRSDAPAQTPVLVEQMGAYNIVHYKSDYYGIPQAVGPLDLTNTDPEKIPGVLIGSSLFDVKDLIERPPVQTPVLVGNVGAYNIVHYKSSYYGIPQAAGELDLSKVDPAKIPNILVASSLSEIYCLFSKRGEQAVCDPRPAKINYKEYPFALSRIMLFSGYRVAEDVAEIARMVRYGLVDIEKEVMVERNIPFISTPKEPQRLAYKELSYDHIHVTIDEGNRNRILLFNDSYNSGWRAFADGRELEVIPANGLSMAVVLPEDAKIVDLVFQPKGTYYFKLIHKFGLILLIVLLMVGLFKQKINGYP